MAIDIEKMRADMQASQKQLERQTRKFVVQALSGAAACMAAGAALATLVLHLTGKI